MFEVANSCERHLCTLCHVRNDRLVIRNSAHLLRVENAYESSNKVIRHLDPLSGILVSAPSFSRLQILNFL